MPRSRKRLVLHAASVIALVAFSPPVRGQSAQDVAARPDSGPLVITNVSVVDVAGGTLQPDRTVIIAGSRITGVVSGSFRLPTLARVVDGTGQYVIPGLWDMHVHLDDSESWVANPTTAQKERSLLLLVLNGVTGVRDMGGGIEQLREWRLRIEAGLLLGPRIVAMAGPIVDGVPPLWLGSAVVTSEGAAKKTVTSLAQRGADFIKVYGRLSRPAFFGLAAEAKTRGIPFAGHVPTRVTAAEASDVGQRSIEHLHGIPLACSSREHELRELVEKTVREEPASSPPLALWGGPEVWTSFSAQKCAALFQRFVDNGTWQVPTIRALWGIAHATDSTFVGDARLRFMPRYSRRYWDFSRQVLSQDSGTVVALKAYLPRMLRLVGMMHQAGVPIMAGSDLPSPPFAMPGFSLHDELELLVDAGMTPLAALQAATLNPARFVGGEDAFGTVAQGKVADLVLLEANPLTDIRNTRRISSVIIGGRLIDAAERARMFEAIARAAADTSRGLLRNE